MAERVGLEPTTRGFSRDNRYKSALGAPEWSRTTISLLRRESTKSVGEGILDRQDVYGVNGGN